MNERIKLLAKQSLPEFYLTNCPSALEKFAELIVRECGAVINSENYREHSEGWNDAIEWADGMIKEHFGVEE